MDLTFLDFTFLDLTSFHLTSLDLVSFHLSSLDLTLLDLTSIDLDLTYVELDLASTDLDLASTNLNLASAKDFASVDLDLAFADLDLAFAKLDLASGDCISLVGVINFDKNTGKPILSNRMRTEITKLGSKYFQNSDGPFLPKNNCAMSSNWFKRKLANGENVTDSWLICSLL